MEEASTIGGELRVGRLLGRYQLLAVVGRGGMGQVWLARLRGARGFNRLVAIKTLVGGDTNSERFERMMLEEARLASMIHHPNVVHTLELGEDDGLLYLVMEWVSGDSLRCLIRETRDHGGIPLPVAVNLMAQTLRGLHAAHELRGPLGTLLGVVHRDVSPQNILITIDGEAKLSDFGVAKATNEESSDTIAGEVKGKYAYMAPEQVLCLPVDRRADLFAAGIILYELATGRHPFKRDTSAATIYELTCNEPVRAPSSLIPGFSPELERVILRALEKDPDKRFSTAEEFRRELEAALPPQSQKSAEGELRGFLARTMSAREQERRQVVQTAEANGEDSEPTEKRIESGTSLRGISLHDEVDLEREQRVTEAAPPLFAPPKRHRLRIALGALLVMAAAAAGATLTRLYPTAWGRWATWAPLSGGVASQPVPALTPVPLAAPPSIAAVAPPPATAAASASTSAVEPAASASAARPSRVKAPVRRKRVRVPRDGDLIAPDYAR